MGEGCFFVAVGTLLSRFILLLLSLGLSVPGHARRSPAVVSLPFDLVRGLIVIRNLPLNGQRGDFILDTGCEYGLVVEQTAFTSQLQPLAARSLSATGLVAQQQLSVTDFRLGTAHYAGLTAVATSLAAIRPLVGPRLLGLLGYGLLREYEVVLDYAHRRLNCYPLHGAPRIARPFVRRDSVAFTLEGGKPIASGRLGRTAVRLLLDTGAMSNNLDAAFSQQLAPAVRPRVLGKEVIIGTSGQQPAQRALLPVLELPPTTWTGVPIVLTQLPKPSNGRALPYQGILGAPFICQDKLVSFHYGRRQFFSLTPKQR